MKKIFAYFLVLLIAFPNLAKAKNAVEVWNNKEGITRLERSHFKNDFYQLAGFFQPQINPLYCGIASSVIILNAIKNQENEAIASQKALEVTKPVSIGGGVIEFKSYSQSTFLNEKTDKIKDRRIIELKDLEASKEALDPGLTLKQLALILKKSYGLKVKLTYVKKVNENELNKFRLKLKEILQDQKSYILVNFNGQNLGLKTSGHISPLAAFDELSDSVLVLDVAGHKNSWYFVKIADLFQAMNTKDGKNFRGYLVISS